MGIFPLCSSTEMLEKLLESVCGKNPDKPKGDRVRGNVVLMKKNVPDTTDIGSSLLDRMHEIFGRGVSIQLVSSVHSDSGTS